MAGSPAPHAAEPHSPVDIFSDEVLADPYPVYRELREAGPAVHLDGYDVWALPRYAPVWEVQRHPERFSSVGGPGLTPVENPLMTGVILSTDPPEHTRYRGLVNEMLGRHSLGRVRAEIESRAQVLVDELVERQEFDAVADLATRFAVDVVGDLVGLPVDGREDLLGMADAAFNTFGPFNERTLSGLPRVMAIFDYIEHKANRDRLAPGTWGATVFAGVDQGRLSEPEAISFLSGFIVAGMDTTANGLASAIWLLAEHPGEWARLREDPTRALATFREALRLESPVQAFFRRVTEDVAFGHVTIKTGARVMMLLGSANRDELRWDRPDQFDIARNPVGHVAFGGGTHRCGGAALAEIEGAAVLAALAARVSSIELMAQPMWRLNNVVRGLSQLRLRVS